MAVTTHITQRDIKTFPSERLTDNPDGGGLPVNTPLTGADNEVFNPIALLDRFGDWSARLVYAGLDCPDDTPLYRSFFAITEPAKDPAVAYLAMPAKQFAESLAEIAEEIQSGRIIKNKEVFSSEHIFQSAKANVAGEQNLELVDFFGEDDVFKVGEVIYLEAEYTATLKDSTAKKKFKHGEFVKIKTVEVYSYGQDIIKWGCKATITKPLRYSYTYDSLITANYSTVDASSYKHNIHKTHIVAKHRFYGVKPITTAIAKNSASIQVTSCTEKIAPVINNEVIEVDGIDVLKLPQDGNVQILKEMDKIFISNHQSDDLGTAHTGGQTVQLSRTNVNRICLRDADKTPINSELWSYDLPTGTITWTTPLDLSMYTMPITAIHSQEECNRILKVNADNTLGLQFTTLHDYPLVGTYVSSVIDIGHLQVWHSIPFTQRNWDGDWHDEPQGDELLNKLNLTDYPMLLTDDGTINERYLIRWLDDTNFEFWGERLGYLGRYDRLTDFAPINPSTGKPLMTIPKEAFGNDLGGDLKWATHDIIRINTKGTLVPIRLIRVVQPNRHKQTESDGFKMCLFGDTTEIVS